MLTESDKDRFSAQGYLVVENILDDTTLQAVRQEYADLMRKHFKRWHEEGLVTKSPDGLSLWEMLDECCGRGFEWYQPLDISLPHNDIGEDTPMHIGPAVFDMLTNRRILDLVEDLIGPEITSNPIQHVRIKPPQNAVPESETRAHIIATDWHQDKGVTLEEADDTEFVTVWLAITDATVENGCLQVASGKFESMLPHCSRTQVGIADAFVPTDSATPTPVKAGGAVIFHPLTPHASLPNLSDGYRWSFDLRYNVTGQPTGRSQFPEFIARSRSNPKGELRDWRKWKEMWEVTRHTLANSQHIPQHRWSSDSPYCA
ncbi:MAG: phytanoyl-CoA dioxygenase family protein [Hyphomicrobiales bacterium]|nr:phytanoyl-CoA dioxygenase family protein [Hyphomicrobiales bacterium]MCP4997928.1 phytanoyl-CoA dioxygenase family protein [Hyphomicrobiales bacterium]